MASFTVLVAKMASVWGSHYNPPGKDSAGRVTQSSTFINGNNWVIDMDTADCPVTDIHRLDRYCL